MKILISVLVCLILSLSALSQVGKTPSTYTGNEKETIKNRGSYAVDSSMIMPVKDTNYHPYRAGAITMRPQNGRWYAYDTVSGYKKWERIAMFSDIPSVSTSYWGLSGNAGTTAGTNFIGTTDAVPLMFKVNNVRAGYMHPTNGNVSFGPNSLVNPSGGTGVNTAIGVLAMYSATTGADNTAVGDAALFSNTTASYNTAVGSGAGQGIATGSGNTILGYQVAGYASGLSGYGAIFTNGLERLGINSSGAVQFSIGGYGTAGYIPVSAGSTGPPAWTNPALINTATPALHAVTATGNKTSNLIWSKKLTVGDTTHSLLTDSTGAITFGYTVSPAIVQSSNYGALAGGSASGTGSYIKATGQGSIAIGVAGSPANSTMLSSGTGSILFGGSAGTMTSTSFGSFSSGYTNTGATMTATGIAAFANGFSQSVGSAMLSSGVATFLQGRVQGNGARMETISVSGSIANGSWARGNVQSSAVMNSSGGGTFVSGHASGISLDTSRMIAYGLGSHILGGVENGGQMVNSSAGGMIFGYIGNNGQMRSTGVHASTVIGYAWSADGMLLNAGDGSLVGGYATNDSINNSSTGAGAFLWGRNINNTGAYATIFGRNVDNTTDSVFKVGYGGAALTVTGSQLVGISTASPNSTLHTNGSFATAYRAISSLRILDTTDYTVDCTANTFTVTLPTAVGITGRQYAIVNSGAGVITIATTSSQTFTNVVATPTTLTLSAVGTYIVQSTGANWVVLSSQ